MLRQGSACHNLKDLLKGVTLHNSRRCLLCADDCQPKTILSVGHLDHHLRICVEEGIDPIIAIQMASLNAAECFGLADRGAIVPGLRADIVLLDNLKDFNVQKVLIAGQETAANGKYLLSVHRHDISGTKGSFHVKDFSKEKLSLKINSDKAHVIGVLPGGVVTRKEVEAVNRDENNEFIYDPSSDIVKIAVGGTSSGYGECSRSIIKGIRHQRRSRCTFRGS